MEASTVRAPAPASRVFGSSTLLRLRSDDQLVAQFRAGNDAAFDVLHDRYRQRLFAYVRQMLPSGTRADAEDVLQDVFVRAYFALRADGRPMAARAWLYRVAHNRCVDTMRRPAPLPVELPEMAAGDLHDPLTETSRREDLARLVTDMSRLPEQQRSALLMRELEGLTYADLAVALDCTLPAVKSLLVRARMGLAEAACARDTACAEIRGELARHCDEGGRASMLARRHMRDCEDCSAYREELRLTSRGLGAMLPGGGPLAALLKLLGLGGPGAAAGGSAVGGGLLGGGGVAAGGGAVAATATKVAVAVCCVAGVAGGAREIEQRVSPNPAPASRSAAKGSAGSSARSVRAALAATPLVLGRIDPQLERPVVPPAAEEPEPMSEPIAAAPVPEAEPVALSDSSPDASGGALAPDELAEETAAAQQPQDPVSTAGQEADGTSATTAAPTGDAGAGKPLTLEPAAQTPAPSPAPAVSGGAAATP